jgi:RNA polymerase sigma-70 factor (ECF subfamily)
MKTPAADELIAETGYLVAFASSRVDSSEDAEDLVQETLVAAWRQRDAFDGRSSLRTWLIGILRHKIIDRYRSIRRTPTLLTERQRGDADDDGTDPLDNLFDEHGSWRSHPLAGSPPGRSEECTRTEILEAIRHCMKALPPNWKRLFRIRILDGADIPDAALAVGVTLGSASVILVRTKHRLRLCLIQEGFLR